ncbi:MAG: hypothetical protein PHZ03_01525 [Syntrophomonas sp.]|nr:hypothetical protein [Syntrophomonas sp.]
MTFLGQKSQLGPIPDPEFAEQAAHMVFYSPFNNEQSRSYFDIA